MNKKKVCALVGIVFLQFSVLPFLEAAPNPKVKIPDPSVVQAQVWHNMKLQDFKLEGVMKIMGKKKTKKYPVILRTRDREMVYEFQTTPLHIRVMLTPSGSKIQKRASHSAPWTAVTGSARLARILDSDAYYEDLAVDFLRWTKVKPLGGDSIKTFKAWAYEARPSGASVYSKAHYWISADYLAPLRVDGFDAKGNIVKRVEVNMVKKVPGTEAYYVDEMMIKNMIPGRQVSRSKTYIQINKASQGSGL